MQHYCDKICYICAVILQRYFSHTLHKSFCFFHRKIFNYQESMWVTHRRWWGWFYGGYWVRVQYLHPCSVHTNQMMRSCCNTWTKGFRWWLITGEYGFVHFRCFSFTVFVRMFPFLSSNSSADWLSISREHLPKLEKLTDIIFFIYFCFL